MTPHRLKPKARRIAEAHLASSTRGARLLAAAGGDAEHAARIDRTLDDLRAHAKPPAPAPVIRLPARPYDREELDALAELELDAELPALSSWTWLSIATFAGVGLLAWAVLAAIAFALYSLLTAVAP